MTQDDPIDSALPGTRDALARGAASASRGTILVVDDEPMVVRAVSQILARSGFDVFSAEGPDEAEAHFDRLHGEVHLLLTDVVMPQGGGRRLASRLIERAPRLRVLFMSGFTDHDSVREDGVLPGPLLTKPFSAAKLESAVRQAMDDES